MSHLLPWTKTQSQRVKRHWGVSERLAQKLIMLRSKAAERLLLKRALAPRRMHCRARSWTWRLWSPYLWVGTITTPIHGALGATLFLVLKFNHTPCAHFHSLSLPAVINTLELPLPTYKTSLVHEGIAACGELQSLPGEWNTEVFTVIVFKCCTQASLMLKRTLVADTNTSQTQNTCFHYRARLENGV